MRLLCQLTLHQWTAWSLPFPLEVTYAWQAQAGKKESFSRAYQNRRCLRCGKQEQRDCGLPTDDQRANQFLRRL